MKTFSEFLDEALASFLVKAAARQLFKSKALQKGLSKTLTQAPKQITKPSKITGFQTARGSKYTYTQKPKSWPQTQRTAPKDPYHPTPAGTKQKSDWTLFTTPDDSMTMRSRFVHGSDKPFYQGLRQSTQPKVGRAPVEVWKQYGEKGGREAIHPGSSITDIQTAMPGSGVGLYGAQRKELQQRVNTALRKQRNVDALKRELGMSSTSTPSPVLNKTTYRNVGAGRKESVREQLSFEEFIELAERYYEPDEKLPGSRLTPVQKAEKKNKKRARTIASQSPKNQERWATQYDRTQTKVKHGADNPQLNTKVSHKDRNDVHIDSDDTGMDVYHKPSGIFYRIERPNDAPHSNIHTVEWGHDEPIKGNRGSYIILDKDVANKSIDRNPQPTIKASDKPRRTRTQPKRK